MANNQRIFLFRQHQQVTTISKQVIGQVTALKSDHPANEIANWIADQVDHSCSQLLSGRLQTMGSPAVPPTSD